MKPFKFRLEPILKLRQRQEEEKKRAVGLFLRELHEQQQQAVILARSLQSEGERLKQAYTAGGVDVDWITHYCRYAHHVHRAIAQRVENVSKIQKDLTRARQELTWAAQQTKIMDKLKEKHKKTFDIRLRRKEMLEQDELGTHAYLRNESVNA